MKKEEKSRIVFDGKPRFHSLQKVRNMVKLRS